MRKLWLVSAAAVVLTVGVLPSVTQARMDPSFGADGVVEVNPPLPPSWRWQMPRQLVGARDGSSFALIEWQTCVQGNCFNSLRLFRYGPEGVLDQAFGGPEGYEVPRGDDASPGVVVDSQGRPLLSRIIEGAVVVTRLTSSGTPDPSFGEGGTAKFDCGCRYEGVQLVQRRDGSLIVAISRGKYGPVTGEAGRIGTILKLFRLRADGSRDRRFGHGGSIAFGLPGLNPFSASATSNSGAIYLAGNECCYSERLPYVVRVSASGRFDSRFAAAARRSLRALRRLKVTHESVSAVIVRPGRKLDLLGSGSYKKGFELRLRPNGRLAQAFGTRGLRILPLPIVSAALGSEGATMAVSEGGFQRAASITRILAGGRIDPAFGVEELPGGAGDIGLAVVTQAGRKALVLDSGLHYCRSGCPPTPRLYRFLEGPRPKRR